MCGAPRGKGRAIQRLSGGDIPTKSWWLLLSGQIMAGRKNSRAVERGRRVVDSEGVLPGRLHGS